MASRSLQERVFAYPFTTPIIGMSGGCERKTLNLAVWSGGISKDSIAPPRFMLSPLIISTGCCGIHDRARQYPLKKCAMECGKEVA